MGRKLTQEEAEQKTRDLNNGVELLGRYVNNCTKVPFRCKCGNIYNCRPQHVWGQNMFCGCVKRENGRKKKKDLNGAEFGLLTVMRDSGRRDKWESVVWECNCECGSLHYVSQGNLNNGSTKSCGCENMSKLHRQVLEIIHNSPFHYEREQQFDGMRYKIPLRLDFYIGSLNTAIEVQGNQHYRESWGGSEYLEDTQIRDNIKEEFCRKNNINLVIIKHDEDPVEVLRNKCPLF
jgi:hypothetical protein